MVKTTHGVGYMLNDRVLFSMDRCTEAARAFFLNISLYFYMIDAKIKFGTTDVIVANISASREEQEAKLERRSGNKIYSTSRRCCATRPFLHC